MWNNDDNKASYDETTEEKISRIRRAIRSRDNENIKDVKNLLDDPAIEVRRLASLAIGLGRDLNAANDVATHLVSDTDDSTRMTCALSLAGLDTDESRSALLTALDDPSTSTRLMAARSLAELGEQRAVPALKRMLDEADWESRFTAAECLVTLGQGSRRLTEIVMQLQGEQDVIEVMRQRVLVLDDLKDLADTGDAEAAALLPSPDIKWFRNIEELIDSAKALESK